jgi:hypothetical protein
MSGSITTLGLASGDRLAYETEASVDAPQSAYTIAELQAAIGARTIRPRWRIYVLYPDETINYEIPEEDVKAGGSWSVNYQDGERRSLSFSLYNETGKYTPGTNRFWAGTRLRLDMGVEMGDGSVVWFEKGIFVVSDASPSLSPSERSVSVNAKDKYSLFDDKTGTIPETYVIPVGTDIEGIVQTIMLTDMGNGNPFDVRPLIYHPSLKGKATQTEITGSAGQTYGSILSELATQLSAEIFYNSMGNLTLVPTTLTISDGSKPLLGSFKAEDGDFQSLGFTINMNEIVNRVVVVGATSNGSSHKAIAVNGDAASPLCYQRIGYRTGSVVNDSNITTDLLAKERADYELRKQLILRSTTSITTMVNPLLEVNNLIALSSDFYGLTHDRFLIQGISGSLDYSGTMSVSVSNVNNLPFIAGRHDSF